MYTRFSPIRQAALLVALSLTTTVAPARAQQAPPDIQGVFYVSGVQSVYGCSAFPGGVTDGTAPTSTVPFSAFLSITSQDGDTFAGTIGVPQQNIVIFTLSGQVSDGGMIEGSWAFGPDVQFPPSVDSPVFTGEVANGKAAIELSGFLYEGNAGCHYLVALSSDSVTLTWVAPDTESTDPLPPPRELVAVANPVPPAARIEGIGAVATAGKVEAPREGAPTGYNVYRSSTPGVSTTPENLFASVPASQTSVPAPDGADGSFFVVTATYDSGESGPSNEVSGGVAAATLGTVNVKGAKIVAKGKDFSQHVQVFIDGIPFVSTARVKGSTKVVQKGTLLTGETIPQYITSGKTVTLTFQNENGGIATKVFTQP